MSGWRSPLRCLLLLLAGLAFVGLAKVQGAVVYVRPPSPLGYGLIPTLSLRPIDLDGDGTADFVINSEISITVKMVPERSNRVLTLIGPPPDFNRDLYPLDDEAVISEASADGELVWLDRNDPFRGAGLSACSTIGCLGLWLGVTGWAGVEFQIDGNTHYGWIRIQNFDGAAAGNVLDWAYESTPGVPIYAGLKPVPLKLKAPVIARPGFLRLEWPAENGRTYQVQAKDQLDAPAWSNLSFSLPATSTNIMVDLPMQADAQFFRVIEAD